MDWWGLRQRGVVRRDAERQGPVGEAFPGFSRGSRASGNSPTMSRRTVARQGWQGRQGCGPRRASDRAVSGCDKTRDMERCRGCSEDYAEPAAGGKGARQNRANTPETCGFLGRMEVGGARSGACCCWVMRSGR